jgi:phosphatidylglycerophosphate synthase
VQATVDRKSSTSVLAPFERRFVDWAVPRVPACIGSHHLTLLTGAWSGLVLAASWLAATSDVAWLTAVSVLIALQYVTDAIDGKVGKRRGAGLVRWGYYMDHFLDYVFLCALLLGYTLLLPADHQFLMVPIVAVSGAFMVSAFLARAVTGELPISYLHLGPIEVRLVFIGINTWLMTWGQGYMVVVIPYVVAGALVVLTALVYQTQRTLWRVDREQAEATVSPESGVRFDEGAFAPPSRTGVPVTLPAGPLAG